MSYKSRLVAIFLVLRTLVLGGTPIANVSSAEPFTLDGNSVWAAGVSSWPMVLGDDIETVNAPATITFGDGSRVSLAPHSHAKLTGTEAEPKVVLLAGSADYNLAAGSKLTLTREVSPNEAGSGIAETKPVQNKSKKALYGILIAGGAAGGIGAALMGGHHSGSSSSSSGQTQLSPQ